MIGFFFDNEQRRKNLRSRPATLHNGAISTRRVACAFDVVENIVEVTLTR
jgi:hypothetical protein